MRVERVLVDARVVGPLLLDAGRLSRNTPTAGYAASSDQAWAKCRWLLFAAVGAWRWVDRPSEGPLENLLGEYSDLRNEYVYSTRIHGQK